MGHYAAEMGDYGDYLCSQEYRDALGADRKRDAKIQALVMEGIKHFAMSSFCEKKKIWMD